MFIECISVADRLLGSDSLGLESLGPDAGKSFDVAAMFVVARCFRQRFFLHCKQALERDRLALTHLHFEHVPLPLHWQHACMLKAFLSCTHLQSFSVCIRAYSFAQSACGSPLCPSSTDSAIQIQVYIIFKYTVEPFFSLNKTFAFEILVGTNLAIRFKREIQIHEILITQIIIVPHGRQNGRTGR